MKIERAHVATNFKLAVDRADLEAIEAALHQVYHYQLNKIDERHHRALSKWIDVVEEALRMDNAILKQSREAIAGG